MPHNASIDVIIARLVRARERLGLSQAELARRTGLPQAQVSKLEAGRVRNPGLGTVMRLSAGLGLPLGAVTAVESSEYEGALRLSERAPVRQQLSPGATIDLVPVESLKEVDGVAVLTSATGRTATLWKMPARPTAGQRDAFASALAVPGTAARLLIRALAGGQLQTVLCLTGPSGQAPARLEAQVGAAPFSTAEARQLLFDAMNLSAPEPVVSPSVPDTDIGGPALARLVAPAELHVTENALMVNRRSATTVAVHSYPAAVEFGFVAHLLRHPGMVFAVDLDVVDRRNWLRHARQRQAVLQAELTLDREKGVAPNAKGLARERDLDELRTAVEEGVTSVFGSSAVILLAADTRKHADDRLAELENQAGKLGLMTRQLTYRHLEGYQATIPEPMAGSPALNCTLHTQAVAALLPA